MHHSTLPLLWHPATVRFIQEWIITCIVEMSSFVFINRVTERFKLGTSINILLKKKHYSLDQLDDISFLAIYTSKLFLDLDNVYLQAAIMKDCQTIKPCHIHHKIRCRRSRGMLVHGIIISNKNKLWQIDSKQSRTYVWLYTDCHNSET